MKPKRKIPPHSTILVVFWTILVLTSCKNQRQDVLPNNDETYSVGYSKVIKRAGNLLSLKNIRFAAGKLVGLNDQEASRYNFNIPQENQLIYLRFDVNETYKAIKTIEEDITIVLLYSTKIVV